MLSKETLFCFTNQIKNERRLDCAHKLQNAWEGDGNEQFVTIFCYKINKNLLKITELSQNPDDKEPKIPITKIFGPLSIKRFKIWSSNGTWARNWISMKTFFAFFDFSSLIWHQWCQWKPFKRTPALRYLKIKENLNSTVIFNI